MIALKTKLNGKTLCIAGAEDLCVLNSIVNAVGKLGSNSYPKRNSNEPADLYLSVGGLTARSDMDDQHVRWVENHELFVGDEVIITVVDAQKSDIPISRFSARSTIENHERNRFEEARRTYFELRDKYETESNNH